MATPSNTFNIDDLIPDELKKAVGAMEKVEDDEEEESGMPKNANEALRHQKQPYELDQEDDDDDDEDEDDIEEDEGAESHDYPNEEEDDAESTMFSPRETEDDEEEELQLDEESINALIEGDVNAVVKKKAPTEDDVPTWHSNKAYKSILEKAGYAGLNQKQLDKLIQEASDTKVLENSTYTNALKTKVEALENEKDVTKAELERLRAIEKAAYFDNSELIQEKYGKPMHAALNEMAKIIDFEGIDIPINTLALTKDRTSLNKLLEDYALDDESRTKLYNHWKAYQELTMNYNQDKVSAKADLKKHLSTTVSDEVVSKVLRNSLSDFIKSDEQYAYIKQGITEGLDKNPDVNDVIALGKNNFTNIMKVIGNPHDVIHNDKYLSGLAKFMLDAAHNKLQAKKFNKAKEEYAMVNKNFLKVVEAYRELAKTAKGITGERKGVLSTPKGKKEIRESQKEVTEKFKSFLSKDLKIEDLLEF